MLHLEVVGGPIARLVGEAPAHSRVESEMAHRADGKWRQWRTRRRRWYRPAYLGLEQIPVETGHASADRGRQTEPVVFAGRTQPGVTAGRAGQPGVRRARRRGLQLPVAGHDRLRRLAADWIPRAPGVEIAARAAAERDELVAVSAVRAERDVRLRERAGRVGPRVLTSIGERRPGRRHDEQDPARDQRHDRSSTKHDGLPQHDDVTPKELERTVLHPQSLPGL